MYFSAEPRMAAFSYQQHHPFLLDSVYLPNHTIKMPILPHQVEEMSIAPPGFLYCSAAEAITEASASEARNLESTSSLDSARIVPSGETQLDRSSSVLVEPQGSEAVTKPQGSMEKKRKSRDSSSLSNVQSKGSKSRKQKKPTEEKPKSDEVMERKPGEEPPTGYIHVRARRGQATDSHSLAERVRREKISERMKLLQSLVPGCDKVTGKALMLDEIINYVQSLQNQVEFLSMKLASTNPMLYDFALDFEGSMDQPQAAHGTQRMGSMPQDSLSVPSVLQASPIQSIAFEEANKDYPMMDTPSSFWLHGQGPIALSQDHGSFLMQVGEARQGNLHPLVFNNMCNFQ